MVLTSSPKPYSDLHELVWGLGNFIEVRSGRANDGGIVSVWDLKTGECLYRVWAGPDAVLVYLALITHGLTCEALPEDTAGLHAHFHAFEIPDFDVVYGRNVDAGETSV